MERLWLVEITDFIRVRADNKDEAEKKALERIVENGINPHECCLDAREDMPVGKEV